MHIDHDYLKIELRYLQVSIIINRIEIRIYCVHIVKMIVKARGNLDFLNTKFYGINTKLSYSYITFSFR